MWKDVKNYEGLYQCSDKGEIRSCKTLKTLKYRYDKDGYGKVILYNKGKGVEFRVHRLIAETFIPNPNKLPLINHKDEVKNNNCIENLEWCSYEYNNNYGNRNYNIHKSQLNNPKISKKVLGYNNNGDIVVIFPSTREARRNGYTSILNYINKLKMYKSLYWKYE